MLNEVKFIGNLTKNVELRKTSSGKSVANLDIALNSYSQNDKKTEYVQVIVWEKQAEDAATYLTKGRQVFVEAKVVVRKREIEGKNIPIPEFHAGKVLYLGGSPSSQAGENNQQAPSNKQHFQPNSRLDQHNSNPFPNNGSMISNTQHYNPNSDPNFPFGR